MLTDFLSQNNFIASRASDGLEGLRMALTGNYCCVLLDLMLPYKSGDTLLGELRKTSDVPVIVLSARGLTQSKIELLQLGADDYMAKPFDLHELLARIRANIKRHGGTVVAKEAILRYGAVMMDLTSMRVSYNGSAVNLTA